MRPRTLAALFLVVAALGAFVWFVDRDQPGSDERAERAKRVLDLEEGAVSRLAWERDGERVELRREGSEDGGWRLSAPLEARADGAAVEAFLAVLSGLEKERTIDDGEPAQMGLAPPRATLEVDAEGEPRRLLIGGDVPASNSMIVASAVGGPFYVVGRGVWDHLERPAGEWRSRDVFPGGREAIERIVLDGAGGRVELVRRGEELWVAAPIDDRADPGTVDRFLDDLTGLQVERFVDAVEPGEDPFGAAVSAVEVTTAEEVWHLELGSAAGGGDDEAAVADGRFARAEGRSFTVAAAALSEALARPAEEWRSLEWARRQVFEIEGVQVRDGIGELTLARDGGEWKLGEGVADFNLVSDLLYAITGTKAEALDAVAAGEPRLSITLDPGAEEQRLEVFAAVGDRYPATTGDRQTALWLGGDRVRDIEARLAALRAAAEAAEQPVDDADEAVEAAPESLPATSG